MRGSVDGVVDVVVLDVVLDLICGTYVCTCITIHIQTSW